MLNHSNSKVLGAFVVGAILVGGSYLAANLKPATGTNSASLSVTTVESPLREPITVKDSNNDGIEDWQEVLCLIFQIFRPVQRKPMSHQTPNRVSGGEFFFKKFSVLRPTKASADQKNKSSKTLSLK